MKYFFFFGSFFLIQAAYALDSSSNIIRVKAPINDSPMEESWELMPPSYTDWVKSGDIVCEFYSPLADEVAIGMPFTQMGFNCQSQETRNVIKNKRSMVSGEIVLLSKESEIRNIAENYSNDLIGTMPTNQSIFTKTLLVTTSGSNTIRFWGFRPNSGSVYGKTHLSDGAKVVALYLQSDTSPARNYVKFSVINFDPAHGESDAAAIAYFNNKIGTLDMSGVKFTSSGILLATRNTEQLGFYWILTPEQFNKLNSVQNHFVVTYGKDLI